jgi:hypothetical protein
LGGDYGVVLRTPVRLEARLCRKQFVEQILYDLEICIRGRLARRDVCCQAVLTVRVKQV